MTAPVTSPRNWVVTRVQNSSSALDQAFAEGLTGHVFTAREGKTVTLACGRRAVEFTSCSYLGLETHPALLNAAVASIGRVGVHFASARTRMRTDDLDVLERNLCAVYGGASVTAFTSVGNVHLGLLPLLGAGYLPSYPVARDGVTFFLDRTAHASIQVLRGVLEQLGPVRRFDSEDPESLPGLLRDGEPGRTPVALVDGVGSMGGLVNVASLAAAVEKAGGYLYVDDAHGVSTMGRHGAGYAYEVLGGSLPDHVILAGSLSKGFGGQGGFCALRSDADTRLLRRFGNPLIFGGPLSLPMISANRASSELHLDGTVARLQEELWANVRLFDERTGHQLVNAGVTSPVRGAMFPTEEDALAATRRLSLADILVTPAFYPTVERGHGLVRFAVSALHSAAEIERAARALAGDHPERAA
ncbi:aminotransferase class I/II-fold pyridoxal phosphate-dependent enzyme [Micromonospora rifamycinica]|uniref:aminotransferase class I/II-fold pyridoxal phosphate-dependent enzyme n=1 Tax=Micromonospora rifamycinica TaxID=291594 RepID=UPI002E2CA99C|nr:aminotransferase class I/II-fold pyridoxal phosphate-dependent enzyme [Micromonospora rifamycinica]